MKQGIVACLVHSDNETTLYCPNCRSYQIVHTAALGKKWHEKGTCSQCDAVRQMVEEYK